MTKLTANDLEIIQTPIDLNGQRLKNGARTESNTDLITRGEVSEMQTRGLPTLRLENGYLIASIPEESDLATPEESTDV